MRAIATLAQLVEQCFRKAEVPSSNLGGGFSNYYYSSIMSALKKISIFVYLFVLFEIVIAAVSLSSNYTSWSSAGGNLGYAYSTHSDFLKILFSPITLWMAITFSITNLFLLEGRTKWGFIAPLISAGAAWIGIFLFSFLNPYVLFLIGTPIYIILFGFVSMIMGVAMREVEMIQSAGSKIFLYALPLICFLFVVWWFTIPVTAQGCRGVVNDERKKACYLNLVEQGGSWKSCLDLQGNDSQDCFYFYLYFSEERKYKEVGENLCRLITTSSGTKSYCYSVLGSRAVREKNFDLCLEIEDQNFKDGCFLEFVRGVPGPVRNEKGLLVCNEIRDFIVKGKCMDRLAR